MTFVCHSIILQLYTIMTHNRPFKRIFSLCIPMITVYACFAQKFETSSNKQDRQSIPESSQSVKIVRDFPYIYADTAYAGEDYNVVVRAVWMTQRGRKTKITSPDQLPKVSDDECVKFISFSSDYHIHPSDTNKTSTGQQNGK